jgi:hypothetical protein
MEDKKYKDTVTIRFSTVNKPVYEMLGRLADKNNITANKYIENILVKHVKDKGISWIEPDDSPEGVLIPQE